MAVLFWIRLDQSCPKLIKIDHIGFLTNDRRTFHLDHRDLVQIGSNQINLAQIGSNQMDLMRLIGSNWTKLDKIGSNQIK